MRVIASPTLPRFAYSPTFAHKPAPPPTQTGADLSHVFTTPAAAPTIKCYSPDLIVHPYLAEGGVGEDESPPPAAIAAAVAAVTRWLPRFDAVVVGPGLGRDAALADEATQVSKRGEVGRKGGEGRFKKKMNHNHPTTPPPLSQNQILRAARTAGAGALLDADGIALVAAAPDTVRGWRSAILTPNAVEFGRLATALGVDPASPHALQGVADALDGPTVVAKGAADRVAAAGRPSFSVTTTGSPRRVGGQGDVLSGTIATFLAWAVAAARRGGGDVDTSAAVEAGATLARAAAAAAYEDKGRSMLASDVLDGVGVAFGRLF